MTRYAKPRLIKNPTAVWERQPDRPSRWVWAAILIAFGVIVLATNVELWT